MVQKKRQFKGELDAENSKLLVTPPVASFKRLKPSEIPEDTYVELEESVEIAKKQINKMRTLMLGSRGITFITRHLMTDLSNLFVNMKTDHKVSRASGRSGKFNFYTDIREMAETKNCENIIYFEMHKHTDTYLYLGKTQGGPSAKFLVQNLHTQAELRLVGNCLKGSRPILSFCEGFNGNPAFKVFKELFSQIFSVPRYHAKSKPFIDHVMTFSVLDGRIWVRNYQIVITPSNTTEEEMTLAEIGPRFALLPVVIFSDVFSGKVLYKNEQFITPNEIRRRVTAAEHDKFRKQDSKAAAYDEIAKTLNLGKTEEEELFK